MNEEQREQRKRLSSRHDDLPAIFQVDLDRAENPEPQIHREREPTSALSDLKAAGESLPPCRLPLSTVRA